MNTKDIPKGWWLNVTLMARKENPSWIVGILREGKNVWITENVIADLKTSEQAYEKGLQWINKYQSIKK